MRQFSFGAVAGMAITLLLQRLPSDSTPPASSSPRVHHHRRRLVDKPAAQAPVEKMGCACPDDASSAFLKASRSAVLSHKGTDKIYRHAYHVACACLPSGIYNRCIMPLPSLSIVADPCCPHPSGRRRPAPRSLSQCAECIHPRDRCPGWSFDGALAAPLPTARADCGDWLWARGYGA